MNKIYALFLLVLIVGLPTIQAELNDTISDEDKAAFDEILSPVMKIYNFIKYSATVIAAIFIIFGAINFMTAGDDQRKRNNAKKGISYTLIGLIIVWAVPYVIHFLVG